MGRPAEGIRASVSAEATLGEGVRAERQHRANRRDERAAQGRPYEDAGRVGGFERRVGLAQPIVTGHVGQPGAEGDPEEKRSCAQHEDDERIPQALAVGVSNCSLRGQNKVEQSRDLIRMR